MKRRSRQYIVHPRMFHCQTCGARPLQNCKARAGHRMERVHGARRKATVCSWSEIGQVFGQTRR